MTHLTLERRIEGRIEQVMFYEEFYTHYTEEEGRTTTCNQTYVKIGKTKEECIKAYETEGFGGSQ